MPELGAKKRKKGVVVGSGSAGVCTAKGRWRLKRQCSARATVVEFVFESRRLVMFVEFWSCEEGAAMFDSKV